MNCAVIMFLSYGQEHPQTRHGRYSAQAFVPYSLQLTSLCSIFSQVIFGFLWRSIRKKCSCEVVT